MKFDRYLSIMFVVSLITICCFSTGCDEMQKPVLDVIDKPGGPTEVYLSLSSDSTDAIKATNDSSEWSGIGATWERIKGEEFPSAHPNFSVDDIPDEFEYWIYSHAVSRFIFELPDHASAKYESALLQPNFCEGQASIEVKVFADGTEIYNSGVLSSEETTDIAFNIPAGVRTLTFLVNDGGNGISCDQFILGNPRLTFQPPQPMADLMEGYLSLSSENPEAITPINDSSEWASWEEGTWERIKGQELSERPSNAFATDARFVTIFDHWFFSHAESKIDFHLKGRDYAYFECAVVRPHLCGGNVSLQLKWFADDVEVYNTGGITTTDVIKIEFTIPVGTKILTLKVTDINGVNDCNHFILGNTRLLLEAPEGKAPYTGTYLSLHSESENAIRATNDSENWTGYLGTWEKKLGGEFTEKPAGFVSWNVNTFQHWFYSHAESRMEFELGGHNFVYFDSTVMLLNSGCGGGAAIEVFWLADGVEVHDSGIIKYGTPARVGFDIPAGTRTLTLIVTDGGNGTSCDHYAIGNPRLLTERPMDAPPPQDKYLGPDRSLPEIAQDAELTPGRYRIRTGSVTRSNYKMTRLHKAIGDPEDRVQVRILLHPQPWSETAGGERVIGSTTLYGDTVPDEVVVEIKRQIRVYTEQAGRNTNTIYEYEGELIKNLSKPEFVVEYEVIEPEPHLSILTESGEAIQPSNYGSEWYGWGDGVWGKEKGKVAPPAPASFPPNPPVETFEHWFYSHAPSRMVFELGMHAYTYFDSFVVLPNAYTGRASIEVIWFADDVEVYNSGIIKMGDIWRVGFDIPPGTQSLTLETTNAGDGINHDFFIIGNPTLHLVKPVYEDVVPDPAVDPDLNLPEILLSADLEPKIYRMTPTSVISRSNKIESVGRYIGDPLDRVSVRILLDPQPWNETLDGHSVIGSQIVEGKNVRDQVVIEITEKIRVVTETRGGRTYTVHEYEGIAIKNLTNPQNVFEYGDR